MRALSMNYTFLKDHKRQTPAEEIVNSILHGLGALLSVAALVVMIMVAFRYNDPKKTVACIVFGVSLILTYLSSTLYHSLTGIRIKQIFQIFDHSTIYLLIAGTYTPVVLILLKPSLGWTFFGIVWGLTLIGWVYKFFFTGRHDMISLAVYLGMSWMGMLAAKPIYHALSFDGFIWLLVGGLSYTFGVIFYMWDRLRFAHALWHVFVLGGSICHFFMILWYVIPYQR
jgi:hemolysin III